jgi:hypothetical protein
MHTPSQKDKLHLKYAYSTVSNGATDIKYLTPLTNCLQLYCLKKQHYAIQQTTYNNQFWRNKN